MRIAITGHGGLPAATEQLVNRAIREQLSAVGQDITGVSNLADGPDQLFAQAVLEAGGQLEVIIPAARYATGCPNPRTPATTGCSRRPPKCIGSTGSSRPRRRTWRPATSC